MWSSGPASHGQSSGKGCREQVMTRQPAEENRITVAWPMPRLAPVRSSVRRGVLEELAIDVFQALKASGIEPRLGPWLIRPGTAEFDTVVEAEGAVVPELELRRRNAPAAPPLRARYLADHVFGRDQSDRLLEGEAALQRLRLL